MPDDPKLPPSSEKENFSDTLKLLFNLYGTYFVLTYGIKWLIFSLIPLLFDIAKSLLS